MTARTTAWFDLKAAVVLRATSGMGLGRLWYLGVPLENRGLEKTTPDSFAPLMRSQTQFERQAVAAAAVSQTAIGATCSQCVRVVIICAAVTVTAAQVTRGVGCRGILAVPSCVVFVVEL